MVKYIIPSVLIVVCLFAFTPDQDNDRSGEYFALAVPRNVNCTAGENVVIDVYLVKKAESIYNISDLSIDSAYQVTPSGEGCSINLTATDPCEACNISGKLISDNSNVAYDFMCDYKVSESVSTMTSNILIAGQPNTIEFSMAGIPFEQARITSSDCFIEPGKVEGQYILIPKKAGKCVVKSFRLRGENWKEVREHIFESVKLK